jgi:hypothetical protein
MLLKEAAQAVEDGKKALLNAEREAETRFLAIQHTLLKTREELGMSREQRLTVLQG